MLSMLAKRASVVTSILGMVTSSGFLCSEGDGERESLGGERLKLRGSERPLVVSERGRSKCSREWETLREASGDGGAVVCSEDSPESVCLCPDSSSIFYMCNVVHQLALKYKMAKLCIHQR